MTILCSKRKTISGKRRPPEGDLYVMFDHVCLLEGKESLQEMAISQSADMDSPIKRILLDDIFWERVVSSQNLLKPIAVAIAQIERDKHPV